MTTTATQTEQQWLGNDPQAALSGVVRNIGHHDRARPSAVVTEAALIAGMRKALKPFPRPTAEPKQGWDFPRAGVRLRPDGRYQLRIWLDPTLPDPVQGGACETLTEAYNLGAMICQYARAGAA